MSNTHTPSMCDTTEEVTRIDPTTPMSETPAPTEADYHAVGECTAWDDEEEEGAPVATPAKHECPYDADKHPLTGTHPGDLEILLLVAYQEVVRLGGDGEGMELLQTWKDANQDELVRSAVEIRENMDDPADADDDAPVTRTAPLDHASHNAADPCAWCDSLSPEVTA